MENVPQVIGKKNIKDFQSWETKLESLGYQNYVKLLNSKNYGIPQNRNRCFMVSILGDYSYTFPKKIKLKLRLKDMLENEVPKKYYLSKKQIDSILFSNFKVTKTSIITGDIVSTLAARDYKGPKCVQVGKLSDQKFESTGRIYSEDGISPTLNTCSGGNKEAKIAIKNKTKIGYLEAQEGDIAITAATCCNPYYKFGLTVRKLTPKEYWRLMGFSDEDFDKAEKFNSNSQLYKQAGNSIVVNVLMEIFSQML